MEKSVTGIGNNKVIDFFGFFSGYLIKNNNIELRTDVVYFFTADFFLTGDFSIP
jgi:hypothetical protein